MEQHIKLDHMVDKELPIRAGGGGGGNAVDTQRTSNNISKPGNGVLFAGGSAAMIDDHRLNSSYGTFCSAGGGAGCAPGSRG